MQHCCLGINETLMSRLCKIVDERTYQTCDQHSDSRICRCLIGPKATQCAKITPSRFHTRMIKPPHKIPLGNKTQTPRPTSAQQPQGTARSRIRPIPSTSQSSGIRLLRGHTPPKSQQGGYLSVPLRRDSHSRDCTKNATRQRLSMRVACRTREARDQKPPPPLPSLWASPGKGKRRVPAAHIAAADRPRLWRRMVCVQLTN